MQPKQIISRHYNTVVDLDSIASKTTAMSQLTRQCSGATLIANGLTDKVQSMTINCGRDFFSLFLVRIGLS